MNRGMKTKRCPATLRPLLNQPKLFLKGKTIENEKQERQNAYKPKKDAGVTVHWGESPDPHGLSRLKGAAGVYRARRI